MLFLDELPEFKKHVLEVLRQPMEDGRVTISRALSSLTYPSRIMLVAAMNPCPCGYLGDPSTTAPARRVMVQRYRSRISGPLLDRIDIHIEVPAVKYRDLADRGEGESSGAIAGRVEASREIQQERFKGTKVHCNAQMTPRLIRKFCEPDGAGSRMLEVGHRPARPIRPELYPDPQSSPHHCRPGRERQASASTTSPRRSSTGAWTGKTFENG